MAVLIRCYYDATTVLLRQRHDITVGQSYCIRGELGWILMSRGWMVVTDDTLTDPKLPRITTNTATVPLGMIPIPLQQSYDLGHTHNPTRFTPNRFKRFKLVVALSSRFPNHHDTLRIITLLQRLTLVHHEGTMVLLRVMPMNHDLTNRGEL